VAKILFKPVSIAVSALGAAVAGSLFKTLWMLVAGDEDTPEATDRNRRWGEVLVAAALQGAVFGLVKAALDRASATGFEQATGVWPA